MDSQVLSCSHQWQASIRSHQSQVFISQVAVRKSPAVQDLPQADRDSATSDSISFRVFSASFTFHRWSLSGIMLRHTGMAFA
jgi:hypothetical protein